MNDKTEPTTDPSPIEYDESAVFRPDWVLTPQWLAGFELAHEMYLKYCAPVEDDEEEVA